jgi:hypothetical protein
MGISARRMEIAGAAVLVNWLMVELEGARSCFADGLTMESHENGK